MIRKSLLFIFMLLCAVTASAQESSSKQIVYVNPFTGPRYIGRTIIDGIENNIIRGLVESNRVLVKDFESDYEFQREMSERTEDASISEEDYAFQLLSNLGAKWVIDGSITYYDASRHYYDDGSCYWDAKIDVALQLTDVSKGMVTSTKVVSTDQTLTGLFTEKGTTTGRTRDQALANASELLIKRAQSFAEEAFKLSGYILEVSEVKKDKAETVYINMGYQTGVKKGDIFEVFENRIIAGREVQNKVGELKVKEVKGDDISLCDVKKGAEEILTKMQELEGDEKLTIKSRMKKKPLGGLL